MRRIEKSIKIFLVLLLSLGIVVFPEMEVSAEDAQITNVGVKAKSTKGHEAKFAIDGDKETYYMTPPATSQEDHYRNIDATLDGSYNISKIKIYNREGSYNHYQIYASETGTEFKKIAYKADDKVATTEGEEYILSDVKASQIRINLSYNSKQMEGNLSEIELYGTKLGDTELQESKIEVANFEDTPWANEYEKVATDENYATQKAIAETTAMVGRVIGEEWKRYFTFESRESNDGKDIFEVENGPNETIVIRGNNGIAMASGFNYYLRYYCKVDYNPIFVSQLNMPEALPRVESLIAKETEYDYRYALNFCTYSYTMAFWGWEEYEAFLDWAAMSGINTVLDIVGQEEVIRRTLEAYGYTDKEIKEYISGPAYFAWYYMQNMTGYGGPLPDNWFEERVELGRRMHDRMQTYGITPVLSGFSGMVPTNFKEKNSDATIIDQGSWCGYDRPYMLRTYIDGNGRDYFSEMADVFYTSQRDLFGDITNIYAVDPFHEGGRTGDMDVSKVYEVIQRVMIDNDPDAVWLIQQWSGSMNNAKLQGLKVKDQALVLDLFSEISPGSAVMEQNQIPWIWNMLHNFGGRMGLDANPEKVSQNIPNTYNNSKYMKGIGMTPEAIENSPMAYELLWDMTWTKDPIDFREWSQKYAERVYGGTNEDIQEVWDILLETGYNRKDSYYQGAPESVINSRPTTNFTSASTWGHSTINYDKKQLEKAVTLMAKNYDEFKDSPAFIYDFSDITRQVISNSAQEYHTAMVAAYQNGNLAEFKMISDKFLEMILLQDEILSTNPDFLVGTWMEESRTMLNEADDWTKDLFEFNARSLITTWGGQKNATAGLKDYSNRQWAGLTKDYYYPRWDKWVSDVKTSLKSGTSIPQTNWFLMEWEWANKKSDEGSLYSTNPTDLNLGELAQRAYEEYSLASLEELTTISEAKQNIALGKTVTSSVPTNPEYPTENMTDGNKESAWMATQAITEFSLSVDLETESSIDGIEIALEQIAGGFPYTYKVEVLRDAQWTVIAEDDAGEITSQTLIEYRGIAGQVRFTFKTTNVEMIPKVTELLIFGKTENKANYENVALGKPVLTPDGKTNHVTDGNPGSLWVKSNGNYPALLTLDLGEEKYVDIMELYFEKAGLRYQYDVIVEDGDGNQTTIQDMSANTEDLSAMYKLGIHAKVQKVYVHLKARAPGGEFYAAWAALGEIKLLRESEVTFASQNIAFGKPGYVINDVKPYSTTKLSDGSLTGLENVGSDIFPSTFSIDLGNDQEINDVKIYFEKAGIRFKFKVEIENAKGEKTVILDKTDNTENLDAAYQIPANLIGKKINVVIEGRAPGGDFYLASPAMTEIEVYAKPKNIAKDSQITSNISLSEEDKAALVDGKQETSITLNAIGEKEFIFEFEKPMDIYAFELYKESLGALQYRVEYLDEKNLWVMLKDESNNLNDSKKYIYEFGPLLTNKMRLTILNESAKISGFHIYQSNASLDLMTYITIIKANLAAANIGEYAGNYTKKAKEALEVSIVSAESMVKDSLNSKEVEKEIQTLKASYQAFLKSYVTIDRTGLLVKLTEVKVLLQMDELKANPALLLAHAEAKVIYDTVKVTQKALDASKETLIQAQSVALATLDSHGKFKAQLNIAKALRDNAVVGSDTGNVSRATIDALNATITNAEAEIKAANQANEVDMITEELIEAINKFNDSILEVDKSELQKAIVVAELLIEKEYTKESWKTLQVTLQIAKDINANSGSASEVSQALQDLTQAIDQKVVLDRSRLDHILKQVSQYSEAEYTKDSWMTLQERAAKGRELYYQVSVSQSEIDQEVVVLQMAMTQLCKLDRSALLELITFVQAMGGSDYTQASWKKLITILREADGLLVTLSLNQDELDSMVKKMNHTMETLELADTQDAFKDLEAAIDRAKAYRTPEKYTLESYTAFDHAYNNATSLWKKRAKPTNSEIRKAIQALENSIKGLKVVNANPKPGGGEISAGTIEKQAATGDQTNVVFWMSLLSISSLFVIRRKWKTRK